MSHNLKGLEYWLEANGKKVAVDGEEYIVKVSSHKAIYPYERYIINVHLDPVNKNSEEYKRIKRILGDNWTTDLLESGDDIYACVYGQLFSNGD